LSIRACFLGGELSGSGSTSGSGSGSRSGTTDAVFLSQSVVNSQLDAIIGNLAANTPLAPDSNVVAFGQALDTQAADSIIAAQAALAQQGMTMPSPSQADEQMIQQLATLNGTQFETQFLNQAIQQLQSQLAAANQEVQTGTALVVRSYAADQITPLQTELQSAENLLSQLQASGSGS
jgi:putative membrane protein